MRAILIPILFVVSCQFAQPMREPLLVDCKKGHHWRKTVLTHPDFVRKGRRKLRGKTFTTDVKLGNELQRKCIMELWRTHEHNKRIYDANKPTLKKEAGKAGFWTTAGIILGYIISL